MPELTNLQNNVVFAFVVLAFVFILYVLYTTYEDNKSKSEGFMSEIENVVPSRLKERMKMEKEVMPDDLQKMLYKEKMSC